ncbi:MAG: helix-turn-helix domain-containing protein [Ruminococcaceae bacterium]|nr:helix-turn-helix domain-containing protein [Oscillospiraceae bacterium]
MSERKTATLSIERELKDELRVIEYGVGNGDFHFHSQVEICIVEDGSVEALVNNSQATLEKGDIAVSLPYDPHRYIAKDGVRYSVLVIPSEMGEKFCSDMKSLTSPFLKQSEGNSVIFSHLSCLKKADNGELDKLGYVYLILGAIKKELLSESKESGSDNELLSALLLYIHKNYGKNLTLSSIAKAFGYHPAYISSYFKTRLDIGISRYVSVIRLNNAVQLMRKKKYSVTEIALECGFNSARTFYRAFREEFGCSPGDYIANL